MYFFKKIYLTHAINFLKYFLSLFACHLLFIEVHLVRVRS